jgi:hypothetical protein
MLTRLQREYCPPLDPALIYAICSDFDLSHPQGIQYARESLDGLKQGALEQQYTEFDPSGSYGVQRETDASEQSESTSGSRSPPPSDLTSLSQGLCGISLGTPSNSGSSSSVDLSEAHGGYFDDAEKLPAERKELMLAETFPDVRLQQIQFVLKKCGGCYAKATDELLNLVYFENHPADENERVPKGIDAFAEEHGITPRGRRGKGKKKKKKIVLTSGTNSPLSSPSIPEAPTNIWLDATKDIERIASTTRLPKKSVHSLYHKNGASLSATIMALVEKNLEENENLEPDPETVSNAFDLTEDFPTLQVNHATALVRLTAPSTASAHELAKALSVRRDHSSTPASSSTELIPQYAPLVLGTSSPSTTTASASLSTLSFPTPQTAASLSTARGAAFTQAASAYRRGKSDNLMKAASGYYAQLGHDYHAAVLAASAAEADALVAQQTHPTQVDLHGMSVKDAVRIAENRVERWWAGLGEERIPGQGRRGIGAGYAIVVGVGRHSEGGKSKLGPAVVRGLVKDGWRVEVGSGVVTVMGKVRR